MLYLDALGDTSLDDASPKSSVAPKTDDEKLQRMSLIALLLFNFHW